MTSDAHALRRFDVLEGTVSVDVWELDLDRAADERVLDGVERARLARYRRPTDRRRRASLWVAMREITGARLSLAPREVRIDRRCRCCSRPHGPPQLVHPAAPVVALAASGRHGLMALCDGPVGLGIDVEQVRPVRSPSAPSAVGLATAAPDPRVLLARWVRRESVAKAAGVGVRLGLRWFQVDDDAPAAQRVTMDRMGRHWWLEDLEGDARWVGALAVSTPPVQSVALP